MREENRPLRQNPGAPRDAGNFDLRRRRGPYSKCLRQTICPKSTQQRSTEYERSLTHFTDIVTDEEQPSTDYSNTYLAKRSRRASVCCMCWAKT